MFCLDPPSPSFICFFSLSFQLFSFRFHWRDAARLSVVDSWTEGLLVQPTLFFLYPPCDSALLRHFAPDMMSAPRFFSLRFVDSFFWAQGLFSVSISLLELAGPPPRRGSSPFSFDLATLTTSLHTFSRVLSFSAGKSHPYEAQS